MTKRREGDEVYIELNPSMGGYVICRKSDHWPLQCGFEEYCDAEEYAEDHGYEVADSKW